MENKVTKLSKLFKAAFHQTNWDVKFKYIFTVVFIVVSMNTINGQIRSVTDSLEKVIKKNVLDSTRTIAYLQLFETHFQSDTAKAFFYLSKLAGEIENKKYTIPSNWIFHIGNVYSQYKNDYPNAVKFYNLAYQKAKEENIDIQIYYECFLGYTYSNMGEHENARKHLLNSIETAESKKIIKYLPFAYLAYAFELRNAGELNKAVANFTKSYEKSKEIADSTYIHVALHEIGNIYSMKGDFNQAVDYHKRALIIREKMNQSAYLLYSYNDIAIDYYSMDSTEVALKYYLKAENIAKNANDKYILFKVTVGIVNCYFVSNNFEKASLYLSKMQLIADELNIKSIYKDLYELLYRHNRSLEKYPEALQYLELAVHYKDSVSSEEIQKNLNDLDIKYETVKKDKEIIENQSYMKRQRLIIIFSVIGLVVFAVFILVVFRLYSQKKEAFSKLEIQNQEIIQQKEEIQSQAEHLEQANREITNQKNIIERSHYQITASITYAKRIQEAILPKDDMIQMLLPEHFIYYKPRDIVSGDFYFIKLYKNNLFVTAADCTGHGVPGAFMSMLGIAFLNDLIRKPEIENSAQLLDELRNQIKTSLQQTGKSGETQDGMDIAFLTIDIETNSLSYAGANNPLFLIRNNELLVYKADSMPISIFTKERPFTNQKIELQKDDMLYIFSDGFISQFDDRNKDTYKSRRFKELLINMNQKPLSEQKENLESELSKWQGNNMQTDDILVIGIRYSYV
jgi:serine phosphatase RsbU (regulator of sigma subunit)